MRPLDAWTMPLSGTSLVEASAGTGKTYTLTTLYLRLLVEEDLSPAEILVVTYTQAATAELRERVRERIQAAIEAGEVATLDVESAEGSDLADGVDGAEDEHLDEARRLRELALRAREQSRSTGRPDPLRRALQAFDEAAIFTIHGFCQRTLQENAFESGLAFDAQLVEKADRLERTLAHDLTQRLLAEEDPEFVEWLLEGGGKRWQFEPEALLRNVLGELGADETMPIVPEIDRAGGADGDVEEGADSAQAGVRIVAAMRGWAKAWAEGGARLGERLVGPNDLNRNKYKIATIETRWLPELDAFASQIESRLQASPTGDGVAALTPPSCAAKFTTAALGAGLKKNGKPIEDPGLAAFDELLAATEALEGVRNRRALWLRRRFVDEAREAGRKRREVQHLLFFDDLLSELRAGLQGPGGERLSERLREQYRFALIDEFQDTDPVQYDIFRDVWHRAEEPAAGRGLVLIGDPKQAIYSFRDADVFTYLAARENAGEQVFGLPTNWRSDPGLIAAVNALFLGRENVFEIEGIDFHPVEPRQGLDAAFTTPNRSSAGLRVLFADRVRADDFVEEELSPTKPLPIRFGRTVLMDALARDVANLLDSGAEIEGRAVAPSDIAVLCRRKIELQQMKRALEAIGVPCVDRGDADVFESREAWELLSVLQAMMRSGDPAILRGALATGAHGLDAHDLLAEDEDSVELAAASERFAEYGRLWKQSGFSRAFETWRRGEGVTARLLAYEDGERRLTNWLHLAELIQRVASERAPSRSSLVGWLERAIATPEAREWVGADASLLRLERDDEAVSLITLHRSKGLEYPIVYLPSLWEDTTQRGPSSKSADEGTKRNPPVRFHDARTGKRTLDLAGHDEYGAHLEQSQQETFSEQLRLLYVGLTRARHQCVIAWGAIGAAYTKGPLAWLLHGTDPAGQGLDRKASEAALKKWSDADWWAAWEGLAEKAGAPQGFASVEIEHAPLEARPRWQPIVPDRPPLAFSPPRRRLDRPIRTTSFSGLVREGHRMLAPTSGPEVTGRDLDAHVLDAHVLNAHVEGPSAARDETDAPHEPDLAAEMHAFPRGADAGTLLHAVLEETDLRRIDAEDVRTRGSVLLEEGGLESGHVDQLVHVVESVARTPLRTEPAALRLCDVAEGQLRPEVEFTLVAPGTSQTGAFEPGALSELLATSESGSPLERYAERAGRLGFSTLRGYLRGFIDAVFCDGERYFLIDYKSNYLGATQADYLPEALVEPMIEHDYVLQYLVYSVALDRHLAKRLADYDYDRHFGGAYYLFLRGLAESHAPGCGIFFDRPPREIVQGASALMGLPAEARA